MKSAGLIVFLLFVHFTKAQIKSPSQINDSSNIYSIGLAFHYGFVFAHSKEVENTKGSYPWAIELNISKQILQNVAWKECNCFPRTGLVLSYFNFNNDVLGHSFNAAWYIEPFLSTKHKFNLSMKGAAGLSYLTNPYDEETNPENQSYSLHIGAYLALGLGVNYSISKKVNTKFSAYYNHISNGGFKDPNSGINWPAATIELIYLFNPMPLPVHRKTPKTEYRKKPVRKDVLLFGSQKDVYIIFGSGFNASKQFSGMNAYTFGVELLADYNLQHRMEADSIEFNNNLLAGFMIGHEFLMGRFNFSQQLGIYLYKPADYYTMLYQRYGLTYSITKKIAAGINLKAHGNEANFLDGRIIYSF